MKKAIENHSLKFIVPDSIQRKQWDSLVMQSANGTIYQLSWYLDIVAPNGWGIITDKNISTGLPVAFKRRTGYKNCYQPFFTMYFNVVQPLGKIDDYLKIIESEFHQIHITTQSATKKPVVERTCQVLQLNNNYASTFSENANRQIKKALKKELSFQLHSNANEVVNLFKKNKGSQLKEYKPRDFIILENLINEAIEKKKGFCASVTANKKVLASGFFLIWKKTLIFLKGAVNDEGKTCGAMYYLMSEVMRTHSDQFEIFDFGGSNNKQVAAFYHKLGGKDIFYSEIMIDKSGPVRKILRKILR